MKIGEEVDVHTDRDARVERIAADLLPLASQLTRLVLRQVSGTLSRAEGAMLRTLSGGPRRITELADLEGLAQPTATSLVQRMEQRGWVGRGRHAADGRVAVISITEAGIEALQRYREAYRAALAEHLRAMSDEELVDLDAGAGGLRVLVDELRGGGAR